MPRKQPPRDARFMAWLQRKNALYAPLLQPLSLVGFAATMVVNRPEFATLFVTLFVASLSAGRK